MRTYLSVKTFVRTLANTQVLQSSRLLVGHHHRLTASFCSFTDTDGQSRKLPKTSLNVGSNAEQGTRSESEDTNRLLQLIEEFRDETAPFTYSLEEPQIPSKDYQQIRMFQKEVHELMRLGQNQEGYRKARDLLELVNQYYPKAHPVALSAYNNVAIFLRRTAQLGEAKSILITVYEGYTRILGPNHQHSIVSLSNLAAVYKTNGEVDTAKTLYTEALQRASTNQEITLVLKTNLSWGLAGCLRELSLFPDALGVINQALSDLDKLPEPTTSEILLKAQLLLSKGMTCKRMKRHLEAENLYLEVLRMREDLLDKSHPEILAVVHNLAELYGDMKNEEKAAEYHARVLTVLKDGVTARKT